MSMPKVNYLNEDFLTIGLLDCRHEFMNQFSIFLEKKRRVIPLQCNRKLCKSVNEPHMHKGRLAKSSEHIKYLSSCPSLPEPYVVLIV
jgi:hypothetical protein